MNIHDEFSAVVRSLESSGMKKKAGRPIDLADIAYLQGESSP